MENTRSHRFGFAGALAKRAKNLRWNGGLTNKKAPIIDRSHPYQNPPYQSSDSEDDPDRLPLHPEYSKTKKRGLAADYYDETKQFGTVSPSPAGYHQPTPSPKPGHHGLFNFRPQSNQGNENHNNQPVASPEHFVHGYTPPLKRHFCEWPVLLGILNSGTLGILMVWIFVASRVPKYLAPLLITSSVFLFLNFFALCLFSCCLASTSFGRSKRIGFFDPRTVLELFGFAILLLIAITIWAAILTKVGDSKEYCFSLLFITTKERSECPSKTSSTAGALIVLLLVWFGYIASYFYMVNTIQKSEEENHLDVTITKSSYLALLVFFSLSIIQAGLYLSVVSASELEKRVQVAYIVAGTFTLLGAIVAGIMGICVFQEAEVKPIARKHPYQGLIIGAVFSTSLALVLTLTAGYISNFDKTSCFQFSKTTKNISVSPNQSQWSKRQELPATCSETLNVPALLLSLGFMYIGCYMWFLKTVTTVKRDHIAKYRRHRHPCV